MTNTVIPPTASDVTGQVKPKDDAHERHFRTDHLMADLKGRSVRGGAVTMVAQCFKFAMQVGSTVVLARLLTPVDFGLVAMVTAITGFTAMFKDAGLSVATVQRENITHAQISNLFWINVALSFVVMLTVAALAPVIAWVYDEPRLLTITLVLATTFVLGGMTVQHQALLQRQMRFKDLAAIEILSMASGIIVAITMAWQGFGYWALVGMTAGSTTVNCVVVWVLSKWRPGRPKRGSGVRPMLRFGFELTAASAVNYIGGNIDKVLVGAQLGPSALGVYDRSYKLMLMPLQQLNPPLAAVAQPALARALSTPDTYRSAYLTTIEKIAYISWPLIAVAIIAPDWSLRVGLGSGWDEAIVPFRILMFATIILPLWNSTGWLFVSQGRTREHLNFHMFDSCIKLLSIVVGLNWGLIGLCVAVSIRYFAVAPVLFWLVGRKGPVSAIDCVMVLWRPGMNACLIGILILLIRRHVHMNPFLGLLMLSAISCALALSLMLASRSGRTALKQMFRARDHFFRW